MMYGENWKWLEEQACYKPVVEEWVVRINMMN